MSKKRKRVLKEFRLDEISVCDVPAQEGAVMLLMKRAEPQGFEKEEAMFEKRVTEITKREDCSRVEAMRKARVEHPEEFEDYQAEGAIKCCPSTRTTHRNPTSLNSLPPFRRALHPNA